MIPYSCGDPIAGFANPNNETRRDTPYLTIGHTPLSFGGLATSSRGAFAFAFAFGSHDKSFESCTPPASFIQSHQAAPSFFDIPLLDRPVLVRVLAATSAILAFVSGHLSFRSPFFGFRRNLPRVLVCQQLKASLEIHDERRLSTLHPTPTLLAFAFGASTFATHSASTLATHGIGTVGGRQLFYILFFMSVDPVHALGHVLGVVLRRPWSLSWYA